MNQTLTINISGIVFHIEVDAYEALKVYLSTIKSYFNNSEEREEIMLDIEARVAEIFAEAQNDKNQVIVMADVNKVIAIMGEPEQYLTDEEEGIPTQKTHRKREDKKLFRDPDDRVLGGVASGLGAYIGLDTVWVRLFFVAAFFMGFGILTYIILWIVMPEAKTTAEKLKMRGEPINIKNIGKAFESEAQKVGEKLQNVDTNKFSSKAGTVLENIVMAIASFFTAVFNIFGKVLGVAFLFVGTFMLVVLLALLFGSTAIFSISNDGVYSMASQDFFNLIFINQDQFYLASIAVFLLIGVPVIGLIFLSIRMLFKVRSHYSVGLTFVGLLVVGTILAFMVGTRLAVEMSAGEEFEKTEIISSDFNTYVIKTNITEMPGQGVLEDKFTSISIEGDMMYQRFVELSVERSKNDSMMITTNFSSHGKSPKDALNKAKAINYVHQFNDSILFFPDYLATNKEHKIRGQQVEITVYLPLYQSIYLDKSTKELIYDIDNFTNTYDKKMVGRKWVMLEQGLTCLDCNDIEGITSKELEELKALKMVETVIE